MSTNLDKLKESLSALMDNETDDLELRRILKSIDSENAESVGGVEQANELKQSWHRYHVLRESMNNQSCAPCSTSFLAGIQEEIADSAVPVQNLLSNETKRSPKLAWVLGQGAIAASVAALAVVMSIKAFQPAPEQQVQGVMASALDPVATQSEFVQLANISGDLDDQAFNRLRQAVYREFDNSSESLEMPVNFIVKEYE